MTGNGTTNGSRWKLISYATGLLIVTAAIVLLFLAAILRRPVDWLTVDLLLVIAAYLLGAPSLIGFFKRQNGNGSG